MALSTSPRGKTRGFLLKALLLSLLFAANPAASQDVDAGAMIACKNIADDQERLECYDRAMEKRHGIQQAVRMDDSLFGRDERTTADALSEKLGIEEVESISATIDTVSRSPRGKIVITLSNKQVWRQIDSTRLPLHEGDSVTVRSASFGSYLLEKAAGSRSMKVRRIDDNGT